MGRIPSNAAWAAFAVGAAFALYASVVSIMPSFLGDDLKPAFGIDDAQLGGLSSMYFYVSGPALLVVGAGLTRFGGRRCMLAALVACVLGILPYVVSTEIDLIAAGRAFSGFGGAFSFVGALWLVTHWFPKDRFGTLSGLTNAVTTVGTAVAAVLLDNLSRFMGWQALVVLIAVAGLGLIVVAAVMLHDPAERREEDSESGSLLESVRVVAGSGQAWLLGLVCLLFYTPVTVYSMLWGHEELKADHGFGELEAETLATVTLVGVALGNAVAGFLADRTGRRKAIILVGTVLANVTFAAAIYLPTNDPVFIGAALFAGGAFVGAQVLVYAVARQIFQRAVAGIAIAFISMVGAAAAAIFQPLIGYLVDQTGNNFREALLVLPIALAGATALSLFLEDRRPT